MSTSVVNNNNKDNWKMLHNRRSPLDNNANFSPKFKSVKRSLFGTVDPVACENFVKQQLEIDYKVACSKWNMDFRTETTLDPDGSFLWEPVSPVLQQFVQRNNHKKRRFAQVLDDGNTSDHLYFQPQEERVFKPIDDEEEVEEEVNVATRQCLITDFFPDKKRVTSADTKKSKEAVGRPHKILKFDSLSTS